MDRSMDYKILNLQISCELTNVTRLEPSGEDFRWYLRARCGNCGEDSPTHVYLSASEKFNLPDSRGHANLILRCKLCGRVSSAVIVPDSLSPYNEEDSSQYKTIVAFDCRGLEFTEFSPREGWMASGSKSETLFPEVSLTDKYWYDYDCKAGCEVSIFDFKSRFVKSKH